MTFSLAIALVAGRISDETSLRVHGPNVSGTAKLVNRIQDDGGKYVQLSMTLEDAAGKKVNVLQESTYDKRGRPVRMLQVTSLGSDKTKQSLVVLFDTGGAKVQIEAGGKTLKKSVPIPTGNTILATPEFWVCRDTVTVGGEKTYWRFDLASQAWIETKATFYGKKKVKIGKEVVEAFEIDEKEPKGVTRTFVDDKGNPYRVEYGNIVMERTE